MSGYKILACILHDDKPYKRCCVPRPNYTHTHTPAYHLTLRDNHLYISTITFTIPSTASLNINLQQNPSCQTCPPTSGPTRPKTTAAPSSRLYQQKTRSPPEKKPAETLPPNKGKLNPIPSQCQSQPHPSITHP